MSNHSSVSLSGDGPKFPDTEELSVIDCFPPTSERRFFALVPDHFSDDGIQGDTVKKSGDDTDNCIASHYANNVSSVRSEPSSTSFCDTNEYISRDITPNDILPKVEKKPTRISKLKNAFNRKANSRTMFKSFLPEPPSEATISTKPTATACTRTHQSQLPAHNWKLDPLKCEQQVLPSIVNSAVGLPLRGNGYVQYSGGFIIA